MSDAPFPMPPSVPPGMRLELSRARLLPGAQEETERWMGMLHERYEECLDTLSAERMAFEATFRHTDADGTEWLYHLQLFGEDGGGLDLSNPVDAEHQAYAMQTWARDGGLQPEKVPGLQPEKVPLSVPSGAASSTGADGVRSRTAASPSCSTASASLTTAAASSAVTPLDTAAATAACSADSCSDGSATPAAR